MGVVAIDAFLMTFSSTLCYKYCKNFLSYAKNNVHCEWKTLFDCQYLWLTVCWSKWNCDSSEFVSANKTVNRVFNGLLCKFYKTVHSIEVSFVVLVYSIKMPIHPPKRNRNATLFQWKIHGVLFKVLDRDNEPSNFQEMLTNSTKYYLKWLQFKKKRISIRITSV